MKSKKHIKPADRLKRLGIGTVQFGMDYGISNHDGQTTLEEAIKIITCASESGIRVIDTASAYGESETVLGKVLQEDNRFDIVTKTIPCSSKSVDRADCALLKSTFLNSLSKMNVKSVHGLLVHDASDLEGDGADKLFETLLEIKKAGGAKKIGLSVYNHEQIDKVLDSYAIDIIQLPINILDQRLLQSGHLKRLKDQGVEIHARSSFLQGLLLMEPDSLPLRFGTVRDHLTAYRTMLANLAVTPLEAALDFVLSREEIDCVIVGVESVRQLEQIVKIVKSELPLSIDYSRWAWHDTDILDPSNWKVNHDEKQYC